MGKSDKPLAWLHGAVKTPPFSKSARLVAGFHLRLLQKGEKLSMPHSRPMPIIGRRCYELRIPDENKTWRLVYRIDNDVILILEVFEKKSNKTPKAIIDTCRHRIKEYNRITK